MAHITTRLMGRTASQRPLKNKDLARDCALGTLGKNLELKGSNVPRSEPRPKPFLSPVGAWR